MLAVDMFLLFKSTCMSALFVIQIFCPKRNVSFADVSLFSVDTGSATYLLLCMVFQQNKTRECTQNTDTLTNKRTLSMAMFTMYTVPNSALRCEWILHFFNSHLHVVK